MEVAKLGLIFCIIVVIIWLKYPLYLAMTAGILSAILLFQIPVTEALLLLGRQTIPVILLAMSLRGRGDLPKREGNYHGV